MRSERRWMQTESWMALNRPQTRKQNNNNEIFQESCLIVLAVLQAEVQEVGIEILLTRQPDKTRAKNVQTRYLSSSSSPSCHSIGFIVSHQERKAIPSFTRLQFFEGVIPSECDPASSVWSDSTDLNYLLHFVVNWSILWVMSLPFRIILNVQVL